MASVFAFPEPPLLDDVVALRAWSPADAAWVTQACQDPEIARYSPVIPYPYSEADAREWLGGQEARRLAGDGLEFAITATGSGRPLGAIRVGTGEGARGDAGELGYWLTPQARGHGHASRAVRLLAAWAFDAAGLPRVVLTTDPANVASQRVAERCGFTRGPLLPGHVTVRHSGLERDAILWTLERGRPAEASRPGERARNDETPAGARVSRVPPRGFEPRFPP